MVFNHQNCLDALLKGYCHRNLLLDFIIHLFYSTLLVDEMKKDKNKELYIFL